jgi:hypothetical protein
VCSKASKAIDDYIVKPIDKHIVKSVSQWVSDRGKEIGQFGADAQAWLGAKWNEIKTGAEQAWHGLCEWGEGVKKRIVEGSKALGDWIVQHNPFGDQDRDGLPNWKEWICGTDVTKRELLVEVDWMAIEDKPSDADGTPLDRVRDYYKDEMGFKIIYCIDSEVPDIEVGFWDDTDGLSEIELGVIATSSHLRKFTHRYFLFANKFSGVISDAFGIAWWLWSGAAIAMDTIEDSPLYEDYPIRLPTAVIMHEFGHCNLIGGNEVHCSEKTWCVMQAYQSTATVNPSTVGGLRTGLHIVARVSI